LKTSKYLALLRGINVGGKNMLQMKDLAAMFVAAGCSDVATYIQSGNVVFRANEKVASGLSGMISQEIEKQFGIRVPVVLRSAEEMGGVVRGNPFLKMGVAEDLLHLCFLADSPAAEDIARLDVARSAPDAFEMAGSEIYLMLPNGMARTKLTNAYFDSKLKTVSTARNWRTTLNLAQMLAN